MATIGNPPTFSMIALPMQKSVLSMISTLDASLMTPNGYFKTKNLEGFINKISFPPFKIPLMMKLEKEKMMWSTS